MIKIQIVLGGRNSMGKRKFEIGDKVRVKNFKVKYPDDESVVLRMGKVGTIQCYEPEGEYPYNVEFDDNSNLDDMMFKASELEKVE